MKPPTSPSLSSSSMLGTTGKIALVLLPLTLTGFICAVYFEEEFPLNKINGGGFFTKKSGQRPEFRLLMGILTVPGRYEARQRLRLLHALQPPVPAKIDPKFVFCNVTADEHRTLLSLEIMLYDDVIILNCSENMNSGKTYSFFSSLPSLFSDDPYDFVLKTDDDTYFRFPELVESLRQQPRDDLYWGHEHAEGEKNPLFMRGMGYAISWDLVRWIAESEITRNNTIGEEDKLVGEWLKKGGKGKNVYDTKGARLNYDTKPVMYDFPHPPWTFVPNTIAVHRLKDRSKWALTLRYFNATRGLKASKFYHLD